MKKVLFLIHDLGRGGAEKVLVNLVNNMDREKFDISVTALFGGGVNEGALAPDIKYRAVFPRTIPGNSRIMKLFSPKALHGLCVKDKYDIEISYLEGPAARIISGCSHDETKLVSWIHVEQHDMETLAFSFRNEREAKECYNHFDETVCVSEFVKDDFCGILNFKKNCRVLYNTVESHKIGELAKEAAPEISRDGRINIVTVGTLKETKGHMRLLGIVKRLKSEGIPVRLYVLGEGPLRGKMEAYIAENGLSDSVVLLGYDKNPYKYVAKCDLFVLASRSEGFSTAATEALIVGTPVCTTRVSGMTEMLGCNNEWGVITDNDDEAFYKALKELLEDPELLAHYKKMATERGKTFETTATVKAVEEMLWGM